MRRWLLPVLLVVVALAAGAGAVLVDDRSSTAAASTDPAPVETPVLSPRRVPEVLLRPGGDERLRLGLQPVIERSPAATCLVVQDGDRPILEHNPDAALVPASNQKLLVAEAVLAELGADTRFRTSVMAASPPAEGVVEGDLWIVGGGDPLLATDDFLAGFEEEHPHTDVEGLADRIVDAGVTTVTGAIVGDDGRYDEQTRVPGWPDRDYGTSTPGPIDALLVNRGYESYSNDPEAVVVPEPADDPAAEAAARLSELLTERGVEVRGSATSGAAPGDGVEVAAIESPPVRDIVAQLLRLSDNTIAETLVKELGVRRSGEGSTAAGLRALREILQERGIDTTNLVVADGSGLHDQNRLTCSVLVELLETAGPDSPLVTGLPTAGVEGPLRDRFGGTLAEGALHAKTGSLNEATALSGVVSTVPGDRAWFSYLANVPDLPEEVVRLQETLVSVLVRYPEGPAPGDVHPVGAVEGDGTGG